MQHDDSVEPAIDSARPAAAELLSEQTPKRNVRRGNMLHRLRGDLSDFGHQADDILKLVGSGDAAEASWRCLHLNAAAFGLALRWSFVAGVGVLIYGVKLLFSEEPSPAMEALLIFLAAIPALPFAAGTFTAFGSALSGTTLGLVGLVQQGDRVRGGAGFFLNGLLLGVMAYLALLGLGFVR